MKKEDILLKSKMENYDEGEEYAKNQGRTLGVIAMAVIFCIVIIINMVVDKNNSAASYAVSAMFWGFFSANYIPNYKFTKKKNMLISAIASAVTSVASLLAFIIAVIK